ncbi:hypothetical protein STEG23_012440, partial [Scotinomys teguina]
LWVLLRPPGPMTSGGAPSGPMTSECSWVPGGDWGSSQVEIVATWAIACGSTLFHYMVTSSMAGWRLLPDSSLWATSSSFPCPAFLAITKSEPFIDID